jgi:hypothetical protein
LSNMFFYVRAVGSKINTKPFLQLIFISVIDDGLLNFLIESYPFLFSQQICLF